MNNFVNKGVELTQLPPLSLYIHIPWCIKKCPYCDFNSHQAPASELPEAHYINCLLADFEQALPLIWGRMVKTIFIGGGTPSLFSGDAINQLLIGIRSRIRLDPFAEISLEANPGTVDNTHLRDYASAGVNRVSFGIQSFNPKYLKLLGRIHDDVEARNAITEAKQHFTNINLDIIYGLPGQSVTDAVTDVTTAISFAPTHISCYNLTLEPNTKFFNQPPANMPDNDLCYMMQDAIIAKLAQSGYVRYETSAYALKGKQCQHNLNYWQFGDYLGIGAGAHSKLSFADKIVRQVRYKQPKQYMDNTSSGSHIIEDKPVAVKDIPFEFAMNLFRLIDGFDLKLFTERSGLPVNNILGKLLVAQERKLIDLNGSIVRPTTLGQDFLNELLMLFLEE